MYYPLNFTLSVTKPYSNNKTTRDSTAKLFIIERLVCNSAMIIRCKHNAAMNPTKRYNLYTLLLVYTSDMNSED